MNERSQRMIIAALVVAAGAAALAVEAASASAFAGMVAAVATGLAAYLLWPADRSEPVEPAPPAPKTSPEGVDIEVLADPVLLIDPATRVLAANAAARRMIGGVAVGEALALALRHPAALEAVRIARESREPVERELAGIGRQEGVHRLRVADAGEGRLLLSFSDISQVRLAERMRVDFVANASHELRTPLATILGFIETLEGPAAEDPPARSRFLDIMRREAQRMTRLIDDLLSLSRIELDKYVRPTTTVNLRPLLDEVGGTLAMRLEADRRALIVEVPEDMRSVIGDRDQLLQVLHNLVSNALKYGRSGTPIIVRAERIDSPEPVVCVSVGDEGEGIPAEHLPRLTERFYRVDNSRSRTLGGTGLGLAIVKHIVERHRGQLAVESRVGAGTTVSFTLPQHPMSQK